nr:hypothetical protein [Kibdelosporangium phytohabitans]
MGAQVVEDVQQAGAFGVAEHGEGVFGVRVVQLLDLAEVFVALAGDLQADGPAVVRVGVAPQQSFVLQSVHKGRDRAAGGSGAWWRSSRSSTRSVSAHSPCSGRWPPTSSPMGPVTGASCCPATRSA